MNKGLTFIFAFSLGAAAGVAVSWKVLKTKYAQMAKEEIEEVRGYYDEKLNKEKKQSEKESSDEDSDKESDMKKEYESMVKEAGYSGEMVSEENRPYVITPEEFDAGEYEAESLVYFADGVLVDDANNIIESVDAVVGEESLDHFGEYDDDSVYVRNDRLKTDYEILRDRRTYAEYNQTTRRSQGG